MKTHPDYGAEAPRWRLLAECVDGAGGFRDGTALIPHPREWKDHESDRPSQPTKKLLERRALATFDYLPKLIIDSRLMALFRQSPVRQAAQAQHPYLTWTESVNEGGQNLTDWLRGAYRHALTYGHAYAVMDRLGDDGPTGADVAPLVLRSYTPFAVTDWLQNAAGQLTGVQLVEPLPRTSLEQPIHETLTKVYRIGPDTTSVSVQGVDVEDTEPYTVQHQFGVVPVVPVYAHRSSHPLFGQSALFDGQLFVDLFNLTSERRELLRKQTFSILNVPLGSGADGGPATSLQHAQALLGQTNGSNSVLFSTLPAQYLSADAANVDAYSDVITQLIRHIFRLTCTPFAADSRDAESGDALRLKREDFNAVLSGHARELEAAERAIAQLWFRGMYGARWRDQWARAALVINYPQTFLAEDFTDVIAQAQAAQALPLGESRTFRVAQSTHLIERFLPDADAATKAAIITEIDQQPTPEEARATRLASLADRFGGAMGDDDDIETRGEAAAAEA